MAAPMASTADSLAVTASTAIAPHVSHGAAAASQPSSSSSLLPPQLIAAIRPPLTALWGLLAWYLYVVAKLGSSLSSHAWVSSVIIAAVVGCVLNLNGTCPRGARADGMREPT